MRIVNLTSLIDKLNNHGRRALEAIVDSTLAHTHYNVEIELWLHKLLEESNQGKSSDREPVRL